MNRQFNRLFSPDDAPGMGGETETFELLNTEDEKPETLDLEIGEKEKKDGQEKQAEEAEEGEEEREEDELAEIEKELEAPEDDDLLDLVTPVRRKEILAKYPKLFKDFPYLEKAYYRDQQYTEILPTIQDAKVAAEKAQILDNAEREIMSGDITSVLLAAKQEDQEAFNKIADNYLGTLRKVDQQAYYHVLGNVIKDTIITMVKEARALGDQGTPLQAAANVLNQFVFGSQNFQPPTQLSRQVNPTEQQREEQLQIERQNRVYERFEEVRSDLQGKADNVLRATIDNHIDPRSTMTQYVKSHATKEAFENLENLISKDTRFRALIDKLWERAFQSNFDKIDTERIKAAYLSKAKTLLPSVIKKARGDALRERGRSKEDEDILTPNKGPITPGKSASPSSRGPYRKPTDIPKGMTTLDVLMKD